jgi:hypothetical protein
MKFVSRSVSNPNLVQNGRFDSGRKEVEMIPKKAIPILLLAFSVLLTGTALAATAGGQWSGTIARVSGDDVALAGVSDHFRLAGGVTELVSGRSLSVQDLAPGSAVTLRIGEREADGRFRVDAMLVQPKNPLTIEGRITGVGNDGRSVSVLGVSIGLDAKTAFSGRGAWGRVQSSGDLSTDMTAEITLTAKSGGVLEASRVRVTGVVRRSTRMVSREPGEDQEFKGTVSAVNDNTWTIDGRAILVDDTTAFVGNPGVGDFVEVRFHLDAGGNAVADRIQKEDAVDDELEFRGIVEAIGEKSWTISGRVVAVDSATEILGNPQIGDEVEVRADRAADGSLKATKIHKEDEADDEREFTGTVMAIGDASWTIGETLVLVNASTAIEDDPGVGDLVEVRADRAPDGTLTATRIRKEDRGDDGGGDDSGGQGGGTDDPSGHH